MAAARAWLYDGETAIRHEVEVGRAGDTLLIRYADGDSSKLTPDQLVFVQSTGGREIYGHRTVHGWRLGIASTDAEALRPVLPSRARYGRWIDRIGLLPAVLIAAAVSAGVVVVAHNFPAWTAPYFPKSWEAEIGAAIVAPLEGSYCGGPDGQVALDRLVARLSPRAPVEVRVVAIPIVNAAALPGDRIIIFEPLLRQADGPDEVAGVLAHEIAHVENRHVAQALISNFTFRLFLSMVGGSTGATWQTVLSSGYSRGTESEADSDAIAALRRSQISPLGAAGFFGRVSEQEQQLGAVGQGLSYLSTHPSPAGREQLFRQAAEGRKDFRPALTPLEWQALLDICRDTPGGDPREQW